jgi:hypothetical protein
MFCNSDYQLTEEKSWTVFTAVRYTKLPHWGWKQKTPSCVLVCVNASKIFTLRYVSKLECCNWKWNFLKHKHREWTTTDVTSPQNPKYPNFEILSKNIFFFWIWMCSTDIVTELTGSVMIWGTRLCSNQLSDHQRRVKGCGHRAMWA